MSEELRELEGMDFCFAINRLPEMVRVFPAYTSADPDTQRKTLDILSWWITGERERLDDIDAIEPFPVRGSQGFFDVEVPHVPS